MSTWIKHKARITSLCYVAFFSYFFAQFSYAHPMSMSQVEATPFKEYWQLTLKLPNNRLAAALKQKPTQTLLESYVMKHIIVSSGETHGVLWKKELSLVTPPDDHGYWQVKIKLLPPKGVDVDAFDIDYQVITEKIITHKVAFWLMPDNVDDKLTKRPERLGTLRGDRTKISIGR